MMKKSNKMGEREQHFSGGIEGPGDDSEQPRVLFSSEQVVATPGALHAMEEAELHPLSLLLRHMTGDWGDVPDEDKKENELSVERGYRIMSSYRLETGVKVWLITEADRSVTTFLLPNEY